MGQIASPELNKIFKNCSGGGCFVPSLYRGVKLIFLTDVGGLMGSGSLGQSVGFLTHVDFGPVCN